jgi:serine/threonine-protein kinase ATR
MAWEDSRPHEAILRLQQQRVSLAGHEGTAARLDRVKANSAPVSPAASLAELVARTLLRLARYTEEQVGDAEQEAIRKMHQEACQCCPAWEKVHYHHGRFLDSVLVRALAAARRKEVTKFGPQGARSALMKVVVKTTDRHGKMLHEYCKYLPDVVRLYSQALRRGMRHAVLAVSRMLTLWLEFADLQCQAYGGGGEAGPAQKLHQLAAREELSHAQMEKDWQLIPDFQWLPEVALLVSRTTIANTKARQVVHQLLAGLLAKYPEQLSWSIVPSALSIVPERKRHGESIVARARHTRMGHQGQQLGEQVHHDTVNQARRLIEQLKRVCKDDSMGKREVSVRMSARWSALFRMTGLPLVIPTHANMMAASREDGGAMRDYEPFSESSVLIDGWLDEVTVMSSLQRPKRVTLRGSDGCHYPFLCKPKDDLRKDLRMMELMTAGNRMLHKSTNCRRRKLAALCYAVVPLDNECGLIEWVPNMQQARAIIKEYWEAYGHQLDANGIKWRHAAANGHATDRKGALATLVTELMDELPAVLHLWFSDNFRSPAVWFEARLAFTRSSAVMSMIGYSVGLGDRHLENILIDTTTGALMHVDFACLFDHGLNLETPEKVPFRLTQSLIHTFGVSGADGVFRRVCELTLGQLRANKLTILTILSTLRHDPLVEWSKRNLQEDQAGTRESDEADREVEKVDLKLQGINQMRSPTPQSVDGQVARLVNDATDINNLGQMYVWWMPWC